MREPGSWSVLGPDAGRPTPGSADPIPYAMHQVAPEDLVAVARVLRSDRLAQGPVAREFELALCESTGTRDAVSVSSGTAALHVALAALGIGPGDEVIVPSLTFLATANAVLLCGARPVFADVDPETLTLCPHSVEQRLGPQTRAAIAVHFAGHPADTDALRSVLGPGRELVEDACHALGASWRGRPAGSLGRAACFSFHPAKHVTTGEGGAVTSSDPEVMCRARMWREHGIERRGERFVGLGLPARYAAEERGDWVYEMHALAPNYRMSELSAALGASQLRRIGGVLERRRAIAAYYGEALAGESALELPVESAEASSAWHLYALRLRCEQLRNGRAGVFHALRARGIGVQVHYIPVHLQPYFRRHLGTRWGELPATEAAYLRLLSIPLHAGLRASECQRVSECLREVLRDERR